MRPQDRNELSGFFVLRAPGWLGLVHCCSLELAPAPRAAGALWVPLPARRSDPGRVWFSPSQRLRCPARPGQWDLRGSPHDHQAGGALRRGREGSVGRPLLATGGWRPQDRPRKKLRCAGGTVSWPLDSGLVLKWVATEGLRGAAGEPALQGLTPPRATG